MARENLNDLQAFLLVAQEGSFTRAAAQLGVSQSALSHTVRGLETRLGLRLLNRTTRSVSPTVAGERLMATLGPRFEEIETELAALSMLRDKPAGTLRITASETAASLVLWPVLSRFLLDYPDIKVEITADNMLTNIVAQRYDAGVRLGDQVDKDMIAMRISADIRMAAVGSPAYLAKQPAPQTPQDLAKHACINLRLPTSGGLYAWEFEKDGHSLKAKVDGQWIFNSSQLILSAALVGYGIAYLPENVVQPHIEAGRLQPVLHDWWATFPGYHLYYPSRRLSSPAFALLVEALRYRHQQ